MIKGKMTDLLLEVKLHLPCAWHATDACKQS